MEMLQELTQLRAKSIEITATVDRLIANLMASAPPARAASYETFYEIAPPYTLFKGKKPTGVLLPDGRRKNVTTWKKLVVELLRDCIQNGERKRALLALRGLVGGQSRVFLAPTDENMRGAEKIDDYLYVECHYDTQTLLHIVLDRILRVVGYPCDAIKVGLKND